MAWRYSRVQITITCISIHREDGVEQNDVIQAAV